MVWALPDIFVSCDGCSSVEEIFGFYFGACGVCLFVSFLLFIFFLSFCFKWGSEGQACAIAASVTKPGKSPPRPHRRFYLRLFRRGGLQSCRFSSWRRASGMRPPCPARGTMGQWYCLVGPQGRPAVWVSGFEMRPPPGG